MATQGAITVLLDIIPVVAGILLLIAFIQGRRDRKGEEDRLNHVIQAFQTSSEESEKPDKGDDHE